MNASLKDYYTVNDCEDKQIYLHLVAKELKENYQPETDESKLEYLTWAIRKTSEPITIKDKTSKNTTNVISMERYNNPFQMLLIEIFSMALIQCNECNKKCYFTSKYPRDCPVNKLRILIQQLMVQNGMVEKSFTTLKAFMHHVLQNNQQLGNKIRDEYIYLRKVANSEKVY